MKIPFLVWVFQGIPECIASAALVISLVKGKLPWDLIFKIGVLQAAMIYIVRLFPFTPGVHIIVFITIQGFLVVTFCKIQLKEAIILSAITSSIVIIIELIYRYTLYVFGITTEMYANNLPWRIIAGYPQVLILLMMTYLVIAKGQGIRELLKRVTRTEFYY